jgi:glycosyltransferase involved in cell wall biosynthesis
VAAWRRATMCAVLTEEDRAEIVHALHRDVPVVPDGADHLRAPRGPLAEQPTVTFVANFAYAPNVDATEWLLGEVSPRIQDAVPDVQLLLVGNQSDRFGGKGRVPAVETFLDAAHVVLCPLRVGGGVKVKMLEALSRGKAIVSTPIGIQGLAAAPVALARDAASFADAVVRLLRNPGERRSLERAARSYAERLPTWDEAAARLERCYEDVVRSNNAAWPWPTPTHSVARP